MDMIAERLIATREATWEERDDEGRLLHRTLGFQINGRGHTGLQAQAGFGVLARAQEVPAARVWLISLMLRPE